MERDYRSARERVSEERIRRLLGESSPRGESQVNASPKRSCCKDSLAMVYSPYQNWQNLYELEPGFCAGTIFKELDKPFVGCRNGGTYHG